MSPLLPLFRVVEEHNRQISVVLAVIVASASGGTRIFVANPDPGDIVFDAISILLATFTASSSFITLILFMAWPKSWLGRLEEFRLNIALGCFVAFGVSLLFVIDSF